MDENKFMIKLPQPVRVLYSVCQISYIANLSR